MLALVGCGVLVLQTQEQSTCALELTPGRFQHWTTTRGEKTEIWQTDERCTTTRVAGVRH